MRKSQSVINMCQNNDIYLDRGESGGYGDRNTISPYDRDQ